MVKFTAIIRLKPGYDPDETWKIWCDDHAPLSKKGLSPEVKKYTMHRVIKTLNDSDIFGYAEMLFDDVASCERAMKRVLAKEPDEFRKRTARVERLISEWKEM